MDLERIKIQKALKQLMKQRRLRYRDLAKILSTSEATVKRRLNGEDLSLQQLLEIAKVLNVSFYELIELSKSQGTTEYQFSEAQEMLLSKNIINIFILRLMLMGKSFAEILTQVKIGESSLRKILREFEKVGLSKLMPGDCIILLVRFPFRWRPQGQLEKTYLKHISQVMVERLFSRPENAGINKQFEFLLTPELYAHFCSDLNQVYLKYRSFSQALLTNVSASDQIISGMLFVDQFSCWGKQLHC
jgi:transcriptional regulator with XRE-family HTH domain